MKSNFLRENFFFPFFLPRTHIYTHKFDDAEGAKKTIKKKLRRQALREESDEKI